MSEDAPQLTQDQQKELSDKQPLEPQAGKEPAELIVTEPVEFTYGDDTPDWAQGKTALEMLEVTKNLQTTIQNLSYTQPAPVQPVVPTPVQPDQSLPVSTNAVPDSALQYTDPAAYQKQMMDWVTKTQNAALEVQAQPILQSQAAMAQDQSRRNPKFEEVWAQYGPEIEAALATIPPQMKIQPSVWDQAAAMVQGQHFEALAKNKYGSDSTDTGIMSGDGMLGTGTPVSSSSPLQQAWSENADWIMQFKKLPGMTLDKLRDKVSKMGWEEAEYVKKYINKTAMNIHVTGDVERVYANG